VGRRAVFDVAFETNGVAWFAVSDGLHRYDGYHWQRFTSTNGLPSDFVRTVTVTRDGSVWVGTDQGAGVFAGGRFDQRGTEDRLAGPSVRRIVETADGALWFCCDRWPAPKVPGGLTRLKAGVCQSYGLAEGLPSDHLLHLFERSDGRLIALTLVGPAVFGGGRWERLAEPGYPTTPMQVWAMRETPDGQTFARVGTQALLRTGGQWQVCATLGLRETETLCVTRDGATIHAGRPRSGQLRFDRWNGTVFVPASASVPDQGSDIEMVRQAPDGSIWAVGRGTIVRWEYLPGAWEWFPGLPPPVFEDRQGRVWCANAEGAATIQAGQVRQHAELAPPLIEDGQGTVWARGRSGGVMRWAEGRSDRIARGDCPIISLWSAVVDAAGAVWLEGDTAESESVVARFHDGRWTVHGPSGLGGRSVESMSADPDRGLWVILETAGDLSYAMARVDEDGVRIVDAEGGVPDLYKPVVCVSRTHIYLHAYNGLWESSLAARPRFTRVQPAIGGRFAKGASVDDMAAFVTRESQDGNAAILVRRKGNWFQQRVAYGETLWFGHEGWLTVADGPEFVLWQAREWNSPVYVALPTDTTIVGMLRANDGSFWLGTADGVLHLRPSPAVPDTMLTGPDRVSAGAPLSVKAAGLAPFAPRSNARRYSFSWALDGGPWCGFGDWPPGGVPTRGISPGRHVLRAAARDGLGNLDPSPAEFAFEIVPVPIQDRSWFRPALGIIVVVFAGLSVALASTTRRLRRHTGRLEAEVEARTAQLRQDLARREQMEIERRHMQAQLEHAQKMESIGRLAGGVAHDFNNMLQAIQGNAELALAKKTASPRLTEHLEEIQKAARRSSDLTRQLLAFARKQPVNPRILDLNDAVAGTLKMLRRLIGEGIQLAWVPGMPLWPVRLDPSQLDQVLANLTVNARDAIGNVGRITIETANTPVANPAGLPMDDCPPGDYVRLTVRDTGHGMDAETKAHLFEPFFTTKAVGEGTGLGLAMVYGIVRQNGGWVAVESEPGQGSTFQIHLPRAQGTDEANADSALPPPKRGSETVLLVEDELMVLGLAQRMLEDQGYRVLAASSPAEALRLAGDHAGNIQMLVTDVVMPQMNGRDLSERLRALNPRLKCLFISGYTADVIAPHGVLDPSVRFLQKPFSRNDLADAVRAALDNPDPGGQVRS
jgi:signal transduction histidine kinase/ligand-binding sensor domain-containing protein/ActR/RegA family two-component response regulator